jgi:DNA-binding winged helix-turn-helix (wHTH) protein
VYIGHLRQKIEERPDDPQIIVTESGIGYRISEQLLPSKAEQASSSADSAKDT